MNTIRRLDMQHDHREEMPWYPDIRIPGVHHPMDNSLVLSTLAHMIYSLNAEHPLGSNNTTAEEASQSSRPPSLRSY
jgi:hypothetical protein